MPTPKSLVEAVSVGLDLPIATITQHDRNLLKAGFRTSGGRGLSAASMTLTDAAHLIVAALGSGEVRDSAATVRRYSSSRPVEGRRSKPWDRTVGDELTRLPHQHSFIDGIEALLRASQKGTLDAIMANIAKDPAYEWDTPPILVVSASYPETFAKIEFTDWRQRAYVPIDDQRKRADLCPRMRQTRETSIEVFLLVGKLMRQ